ncbi:MAG: c-type cytochrome [Terrimicrobiaceae bacterium]|nr:c-type cytochrome [Terrimicrobiaceae bacterium]
MNLAIETKALLLAFAAGAVALAVPFGISLAARPASATASGPARASAPAGAIAAGPEVAAGRRLFLFNCAHCHGQDARGDEGPDLHNLHKTDTRIHQVVTAGIKGEMPAFGKKLGDADIHALTAFLRTLR